MSANSDESVAQASSRGLKNAGFDLTTFGEAMLRLSVPTGEYLQTTERLRVHVGGAESNVATILAQLGWCTGWFSALPDSSLGQAVTARIRQGGVITTGVHFAKDGRVGTYYLESPHPPLSPRVIYDRAGSVFSTYEPDGSDLERLLDTRLVHLTGITPALGPAPRAATLQIMAEAKRKGVLVSFDVNYRERLWGSDEAQSVLTGLAEQADVLFCSLKDAQRIFRAGLEGSGAVAATRLAAISGAQLVVVSAGDDGVSAIHDGKELHAPAVPTVIIDRPGAGDAMAAGVLHGLLEGDVARGLAYGAALAAVALSHHGDMVYLKREQLEAIVSSRGAEIVR